LYAFKGAEPDEGVIITFVAVDWVVVVATLIVTVLPVIPVILAVLGSPVALTYVPITGVPDARVRVVALDDHVALKLGTFAAAMVVLCFIRRRSEKSIL
jgi:hypothetical protein